MDTEKLKLFIDGRKGLISRAREACKDATDIVWVHSASFGEFEESRPIVEAIRRDYPEKKILLTFFSPSGYEHFKNWKGADWVFYLPLDTPLSAARWLDAIHPSKVIISVSDYWLNMLAEIRRRGIDHYVVSVHMTGNYSYFKWYGALHRIAFRGFTSMIVKNRETEALLRGIGVENVVVAGDPRMDRVLAIRDEQWSDPVVDRWCGGRKVFVAGSTLPDEDDEMMIALSNSHPSDKFLIIPHEIGWEEVNHIAESIKGKVAIYSQWKDGDEDAQVLIVNKVGMLARLYRYGFAAYVGSGFCGRSPHSVIEPACYGMPVAFGPDYKLNTHCTALVALGAGFGFPGPDSFGAWYDRIVAEEDYLAGISAKAREYCESGRGAARQIEDIIFGR